MIAEQLRHQLVVERLRGDQLLDLGCVPRAEELGRHLTHTGFIERLDQTGDESAVLVDFVRLAKQHQIVLREFPNHVFNRWLAIRLHPGGFR